MKKENPLSKYRCNLLNTLLDLGVSSNTSLKLVEPMNGRPDEEKEEIAKALLKIIERCKSEEEMLKMAKKSFGTKTYENLQTTKI